MQSTCPTELLNDSDVGEDDFLFWKAQFHSGVYVFLVVFSTYGRRGRDPIKPFAAQLHLIKPLLVSSLSEQKSWGEKISRRGMNDDPFDYGSDDEENVVEEDLTPKVDEEELRLQRRAYKKKLQEARDKAQIITEVYGEQPFIPGVDPG